MNVSQPAAARIGTDALSLLKLDHEQVRELFEEFDAISVDGREEERQALASRICSLLTVHATIEEEIFYPAARGALGDDELLDDAEVEHASAKALIADIEAGSPGQDLYDAHVRVLGEYINHHVVEEEEELFPRLSDSGIDFYQLGQEMEQRKSELMGLME